MVKYYLHSFYCQLFSITTDVFFQSKFRLSDCSNCKQIANIKKEKNSLLLENEELKLQLNNAYGDIKVFTLYYDLYIYFLFKFIVVCFNQCLQNFMLGVTARKER